MKKYSVTYYYLASGMDGVADIRDYGIIEAENETQVIEKIYKIQFPNEKTEDKYWTKERKYDFLKSCLNINPV